MTVLSYTNALLGIPMPQHSSGKTSVQDFNYPGALQPKSTLAVVLSFTNALLGIAMPQHSTGKTLVQSFLYPGALQPAQPAPVVMLGQIQL